MKGLKFKTGNTPRGFGYIEFIDRYGAKCSMQSSSVATENCIWFGSEEFLKDKTPDGKEFIMGHRMHLNIKQVEQLIPILQHFVNTGEVKLIKNNKRRGEVKE
jgi:hypothetical protein